MFVIVKLKAKMIFFRIQSQNAKGQDTSWRKDTELGSVIVPALTISIVS